VKWSKICSHKKKGGLGFREFRAFNEALLAKQGWRCITQPESMVAQTFKAKYHPKKSFLEAELGNKCVSYTWRSIKKASWILNKGGLWTIGNGEQVNIWKDNWLPRQQGHKVWTTKGAANQQRVKDLIIPEIKCWNRQLISDLFLHFEAEQITQIPITNLTRPDEFSWPMTKDGSYTVRSGYQAILDWKDMASSDANGSAHSQNPIWKKLWSLKIPPKYTTLMWRILNNALPVQKNLTKKGINCYPLCQRCNNSIEDLHHVFNGCLWAQQVWFASPLNLKIQNTTLQFNKWIEECLVSIPTTAMEIICVICYHIWKARNLLIFQNRRLPGADIIHQALENLHAYQLQLKHKPINASLATHHNTTNDRWIPPPQDAWKLNVDAHSLGEGKWGLGWILRKNNGDWISAATRVVQGIDEAIEAEARGIMEAVGDLNRFQQEKVIIESDNSSAVKAIQTRKYPRSYWGLCLRKVREKMDRNPQISIVWAKRSKNIVAHKLAEWASIEPNKTWSDGLPPHIVKHIQNDMLIL
jgi:ribonuclease HI